MESLSDIAFFSLVLFGAVMLIGVIRPDFVLFWTDTKTRGKVIAVFGGLAFVSFVIFGISSAQRNDQANKDPNPPRDSAHYDQPR